jgi:hypothetical protein
LLAASQRRERQVSSLAVLKTHALLALSWGQAAFMGVFVLVLLGLFLLPRRFVRSEGNPPVWWKNVRIWAGVVCSIQIVVYWIWG